MKDQASEIKSKIDIVSVLSEYLDLKRSGRNYKALCPFHSEKTPSFMVSSELQIYKCFGCGEGGDVYDFLQKYEGMDFYEALKYLAEKVGVKLKPLSPSQKGEKEKFYEINAQASNFYRYLLTRHPVGKKALHYMTKVRELTLNTINTFSLGYSPENPYAAKKYLSDKKKIPVEDLVRAGILVRRDGRVFDRFMGRVIFPLHDQRGNILGFAGRILPTETKKDLAKYINSPDTPVYHKSNVLYGLHIVKKYIREKQSAVIVEGELDMISSWQAGVRNVVAIKGSALTQEQVKLLSRYTQSVILALDADIAGDAAARHGIQIAEKEGFEIKVARFGKYKDPDELARKDPESLFLSINKAIGVWDFYIDSAFERLGADTGEQKAKLSRELVPILTSIEDKIVQAHYIQKVAVRLGVSADVVTKQIEETRSSNVFQKPKIEASLIKKDPKTVREKREERLLAVAFKYDPDFLHDKKLTKLIKTPLARRITDSFLSFMKKHKEFDPSLFADYLPKELVGGFAGMILKEIGGLDDKPESYRDEIQLVKKNLLILSIKEELGDISHKLKEAETSGDKKNLKINQEKFKQASLKLKQVEAERN